MPEVSIVLPLYNSEKFVEECAHSLINQSFKDYELIILDDASSDNTRKILNKLKLRYIKNKKNLGFARNINKGIKLAKGRYVMIADHDMVYEKDYLRKMLYLGEDIMAGRVYYYNNKNLIRSFGLKISLLTGKTKVIGRDSKDSKKFQNLREIPSASGGALFINRRIFDLIGLFNEKFNKYYVDVDFCYRARMEGFKTYLSEAKCWHKKEQKETFNNAQLKDYYKDKKLFLKIHSFFYPLLSIPINMKINQKI